MTNSNRDHSHTWGALCVLVLGCILIAGLWPFGSPSNDIAWLAGQPGVRYGRRATLLSAGSLPDRPSAPCTVELWIRPAGSQGASLLAFYGPDGVAGLSLHQSITDLRLDRAAGKPAKLYAAEILAPGRLAFLTVVSGADGTSVYRDGDPVQQAAGFAAPPQACSGRFVVGDFPTESKSWRGELRGLAIYRRTFSADQARLNYRSWLSSGRPSEAVAGAPEALYLFDAKAKAERRVRDRGLAGVDLTIPERYVIAQEGLLAWPWNEFYPGWSYLQDVVVNIGGFVPFGLSLSLFLSQSGRLRRVGPIVTLAGLLLSLTIEIAQSHLPTRHSGLTDVLTNTLGTWLGVVLCRWARKAIPAPAPSSS